jgi:ribosomal protein S18 acetylase RimI-like enzyme
MNIEYKETKDFNADDLKELFLSVKWSSGHYPDKLVVAMHHSSTVFSAWDGDRLVGLINALDDGIMTVYIHFLLIHPDYQKLGIGKQLISMIKHKYSNYLRTVLIAYENETSFYKHLGFEIGGDKVPMFITSLWT